MHPAKGSFVALVILAAALAGCAGSGSGCDGFCVTAPSDPSQPYVFSATVAADNYTWDLGDNLGPVYGKEVQHTYDVANANLTVKLYARTGSETQIFQHKGEIVRGTGVNAKATFLLEAQTDWAVTGERVRFSAAGSTDPDGDALRFAWACERLGDAIPKDPHTHGGFGSPFKAPPAGSVTSGKTNRTLPAPTLSIDSGSDLCATLGGLGAQRLSTGAATLEGSFSQQGIYKVFLIAADPAHPTVSGNFEFVVTNPADRPNATLTWTFEGDFKAGAGGVTGGSNNLQLVCDTAETGQTCDVFVSAFTTPIGATISWANFTYDADPTDALPPDSTPNKAKWELLQDGTALKKTGGPEQGSTVIDGSLTPLPGRWVMKVSALQGGNFAFHLTLQSKSDLDPYKIYF